MTTKKNKAFLLIEVLVTVLIVSVSIVIINRAFSSSLKATGLSNDYLKAILLLEDKSFDFELNPGAENRDNSGEEEYAEDKFHWRQTVLPLEEELGDEYDEEDIGLKRFSLSMAWERHNVERRIEILTYIKTAESEE